MCTKLETTVTTMSMMAVSESSFNAQFTEKSPDEIQLIIGITSLILLLLTSMKVMTAQIAEITKSVLEKICANLSAKFLLKMREKNPENRKPKSGRKTVSLRSIFYEIFLEKVDRFNLEIVTEK